MTRLSIIAGTVITCGSILLIPQSVKADALDQWVTNAIPSHISFNGSALSGIAFGNGRYVAVGYDLSSDAGFAISSNDGVSWINITNVSGGFSSFLDLYDVTYGGGKFVAVGYDWYTGRNIYTSTNGLNWATAPAQPFNANLYRVIYGTVNGFPPTPPYGVFVATGDGSPISSSGAASGYSILMSEDGGQTWWETLAPGAAGRIWDLASGAQCFVAIDIGQNLFRSTDGYTWIKSATMAAGSSVSFCNGQFIIPAGVGSNQVSPDGLAWSISTNDAPVRMGRIIYKRGHYLAAAGNTTLDSTNGIHWIQHTMPAPTNYSYWSGFVDVEMGATNAVALGYYWNSGPLKGIPLSCVSDSFLTVSSAAAPGQLTLSGLLGCPYRIESIDNFGGTNQWQQVDTFPLSTSPFTWTDPQPADLSSRFYRAVLLP